MNTQLSLACQPCDGTGRLENDTDSLVTPMWAECPDCEGSGVDPVGDPLLDPAGASDPNPLDTVDPAWGLPSSHPNHPNRVEARLHRARSNGGDAA